MYISIILILIIGIILLIIPNFYTRLLGIFLLILDAIITVEYVKVISNNTIYTPRVQARNVNVTTINETKKIMNDIIINDLNQYKSQIKNVGSTSVHQAINDAMSNGKNIRCMMTMDICNKVSNNRISALNYALAIEYVHNSSLIIDDMPYFDNDDMRRDRESIHKKHGQSVATMSALTVLSYAYNNLYKQILAIHGIDMKQFSNDSKLKKLIYGNENVKFKVEICDRISKLFNDTFAIDGLPSFIILEDKMSKQLVRDGDIFILDGVGYNLDDYEKLLSAMDIIKTGYLFKMCMLGGFYIGCLANPSKYTENNIKKLTKLAENVGLAYQLSDDIDDIEQDGNSDKHNINYAIIYGKDKTLAKLSELIKECKTDLKSLDLYSPFWENLFELIGK